MNCKIQNIKSVKSINPFKSVIQTIYDIVTKGHGGMIEVESVEGEGMTFIVFILKKSYYFTCRNQCKYINKHLKK